MTPGIYEPADPKTVSLARFKERVGLLFAAAGRGEHVALPVAPGCFRCFTCCREFAKGTDEEADAEYRRRFGADGSEPDPLYTVCDDCNEIISEDQGVPLLWAGFRRRSVRRWRPRSRAARSGMRPRACTSCTCGGGGEPVLRQVPLPDEVWAMARPPVVLDCMSRGLGDFGELLAATAPEGLHAAVFPRSPWALGLDAVAVVALGIPAVAGWKHRQLYPWCPFCHWSGGGPQEVSPEVPDPAASR